MAGQVERCRTLVAANQIAALTASIATIVIVAFACVFKSEKSVKMVESHSQDADLTWSLVVRMQLGLGVGLLGVTSRWSKDRVDFVHQTAVLDGHFGFSYCALNNSKSRLDYPVVFDSGDVTGQLGIQSCF